jgi:uncharacterized repeat protein (TIGR01451 family)
MKLFISILFTALLFLSPKVALADTDCTPIYGGGENCVTSGNIGISKSVKNPQTGGFVANLNINDAKFGLGQAITFQVVVTNNDSDAGTITVTDSFPENFNFVSGPGSYNLNNNNLSWKVTGLDKGESQTFTVTGTIDKSISNAGDVCEVNQVDAKAQNGDNASDNSQFCISNPPKVNPVPRVIKTPPTGPEALPLMALIPGAMAGLGLIKLSKKS